MAHPAHPTPAAAPHTRRSSRVSAAATVVVAVGVAIALLRAGQPVFVPLLLGIFAAYALRPVVQWLAKLRIPTALGAAVVMCVVTALVAAALLSLRAGAAELTEYLPEAARKVRTLLREQQDAKKPIAQIQRAANELDKAAAEAGGRAAPVAPAAASRDAPITNKAQEFLLAFTTSAINVILELAIAVLVAFFLLAGGDSYRRKILHIAGPTLARRRITLEVLNEIDLQIQRSVMIIVVTNVLIALVTWALFAIVGIERAAFWGLLAGLLHIVPYVGTALVAAAAGIAGLIEFDDVARALTLAGGTMLIATLLGMGLAIWLQCNASRLNAVVTLVGLLFFGWLWGAWGLLLGLPTLAVFKAIADRTEPLKPVAELMAP